VKNESDFRFVSDQAVLDPNAMLAVLTQAGYSNTHARRAVLAALCEAGGQAAGAELLEIGRAHHPELGLVTVYRTLEILLSLGLVRRLHQEEGCHVYAVSLTGRTAPGTGARGDASDASVHRHHVICQGCGRAVEFEGCDLDAVVAAVESQTGYHVRSHWLEMFGVCPQCWSADGG
jgi:Fur family ferric uptake transcriptional regulator